MPDKPVLRIANVCKKFGELQATDNVSLDVKQKQIHALIGPNGAGKTTLISQISGNLQPDSGKVLLLGKDITNLTVAARAKKGVGRCFQISSLAMDLSIRRNVMIAVQSVAGSSFRFFKPIKNDSQLLIPADEVIAQVGLQGHEEKIVAQCSHGERRLVEIACALALQPKILLLDEPMAGLSSDSSEQLATFLAGLKHTCPIFLIEHDMDMIFKLADRISVLVYGKVIAQGSVNEIRKNPQVQEAYLGVAQ